MKLVKGEEEQALQDITTRARLIAATGNLTKAVELQTRHIMAGNTVLGLLLQATCEEFHYVPEMDGDRPTGRLLKLKFWARTKKRIFFWR